MKMVYEKKWMYAKITGLLFVLSVVFFLFPFHTTAAKKNSEIDAYEKFLKQKQSDYCQGFLHRFGIDAFYVADLDNDGVYELLVADKDVCTNSSYSGHTHVCLYKYTNNKVTQANGILTKKGGESTFYISRTESKVAVQAYRGDWYSVDVYGNANRLSGKPSTGYKKYTLYKNTEKNRSKYLAKAKKQTTLAKEYNKKILEIEKKYDKLEKKMQEYGKKIFKKVSDSNDSLKKDSLETLTKKIDTALASNLPASAEKAFVKTFTDTIQEKILVKSSAYDKCKTAPQLVNKVASQISDESGEFTFKDGKTVYTVKFNSLGTVGASYVQGTITNNFGGKYRFGGTSVNKATVNEELANLKKYSDKKLEEAKKEVISDATKILFPTELKKYLKTTSKSTLYRTLQKKVPSIAKYVKGGVELVDKFNAVTKAYKGVKSIDIKNTSEDKIVKTYAEYDKKVKAFENVIDSLF